MKTVVVLNKSDGLHQLRGLLEVEKRLLADHHSEKTAHINNRPWWKRVVFGDDGIICRDTMLFEIKIAGSEERIEHLKRQIMRLEMSESGTLKYVEED